MAYFKKYGDLAAGLLFLLLSVVIFAGASSLPPNLLGGVGSDFLPKILAIATCLLSLLEIRAGFRTMRTYDAAKEPESKEEKPEYLRVLATIASFALYAFLLVPVGFLVSSVVYLFVQITILAPTGKRNLLLFAIIAVVTSVAVYFIFRYGLNVMLPAGILKFL